MSQQPNPDRALDDPTPGPQATGDTVFGNPNGHTPAPAAAVKYLSLDEVLTSAKRHRTIAHICMRADLQAEYDDVVVELAGMVDTQGNLLPRDPESSLDDGALAERAQWLANREVEIRREMNAAMRDVVFEAMPADKWQPWYEKHYPHKDVAAARARDEEPDLTTFNNLLIAEVAVQPTLTVAEIVQLRSVLGATQMNHLANQAWLACTRGGVDIPKSPAFLRNLQLR